MSLDHDRVRDLLGPLVLGGLEAAERAEITSHLATCRTCRDELADYAGLPALLRLAGPAVGGAREPQDAGLERALDTLRAQRWHRRRRAVLGAAAAAVAIGLGTATAVVATRPAADPASTSGGVRLVAEAGSDSRGETRLTAKPWGTSVDLDLSGLPRDERFIVWVDSTDGPGEQAATWASTPTGVARVTGASALDPTEVTAVRVTTAEGAPLLSAAVEIADR